MSISIGNRTISLAGNEIYVIAEIGQNHQGDLNTAKELILKAKAANASCVKFQKSHLPAKFTKAALDRRYDGANSWGSTYGEHKLYLEFDYKDYQELQRFSHKIGIDFTASAMDEVSLEQLDALGVPFIKIGSGDANNFPLLKKAAKVKCPLIISTGMQTISTVDRIVEIMKSEDKRNFALLHCVSSYPTAPEDCNLQMITAFKTKYTDIVIGYSGHELGIDISIAAVLLGARILERHFTLDKSLKGSDHNCSLTPHELSFLIKRLHRLISDDLLRKDLEKDEIVRYLGDSEQINKALKSVEQKVILPCEFNCKTKLGKSIVAAKNLKRHHFIQKDDICIKVSEPNGIPAEHYDDVMGHILLSDIMADSPIDYTNIN